MAKTSETDSSTKPPVWLTRAILLGLIGYAILGYLLSILSDLRSLSIIVLVSLFLSFAIEPAVNRMERWNIRRGLATGLMFLTVLGALGGFGIAVGSLLADQLTEFSDNIPSYLSDIDEFLDDNFGIEGATADIQEDYENGALAKQLGSFADDLAQFGATVVNILFQLFTIGLFSFYLVAEGPKLRRSVCSLLPAHRQKRVLEIWDIAIAKTGGYIASRAILALIAALVHWAAFVIIGMPSSLALAIWVGVISQFIPVVGTYIAGVLPLLVGLLDEPRTGILALIVIIVYQQLENYIFAPRITAQTMQIHVAVAFGAVIAGNAILGIVGALLALPFAATLQSIVSAAAERHDIDEEILSESRIRRGHTKNEKIKPEENKEES